METTKHIFQNNPEIRNLVQSYQCGLGVMEHHEALPRLRPKIVHQVIRASSDCLKDIQPLHDSTSGGFLHTENYFPTQGNIQGEVFPLEFCALDEEQNVQIWPFEKYNKCSSNFCPILCDTNTEGRSHSPDERSYMSDHKQNVFSASQTNIKSVRKDISCASLDAGCAFPPRAIRLSSASQPLSHLSCTSRPLPQYRIQLLPEEVAEDYNRTTQEGKCHLGSTDESICNGSVSIRNEQRFRWNPEGV